MAKCESRILMLSISDTHWAHGHHVRSPGAGGVVLYDASNRDWSVQHTKWTAAKQLLGIDGCGF